MNQISTLQQSELAKIIDTVDPSATLQPNHPSLLEVQCEQSVEAGGRSDEEGEAGQGQGGEFANINQNS